MKTTADYIDALRVKFNVDSDFKAMNSLGVKHRQQVSQWRKMHGTFDEHLCMKIAAALEIDPAEVVISMQIQREDDEQVKKVWERIAASMYATAALLAVALALPSLGIESDLSGLGMLAVGFTSDALTPALYIMSNDVSTVWLVAGIVFALLIWAFPRSPRP